MRRFLRIWLVWSACGLLIAVPVFFILGFVEPVAVTCGVEPCELAGERRGLLFHGTTASLLWLIWCGIGGVVVAVAMLSRRAFYRASAYLRDQDS